MPAEIFVGATVGQGQVVGYSGGTGGVAPHLHFDLKLNGQAYRAEPMSGGPVGGEPGFGWYGYSAESGLGCGNNGHDPSPYWTSQPPPGADCPGGPPPWPVPPGDEDCDGFSTADENVIVTNPILACALTHAANDEFDDKWPPDFDDSQVINSTDVFKLLPPTYGTTVPPTSPRYDLVPDGVINTTDVFKVLPPFLGSSCTP